MLIEILNGIIIAEVFDAYMILVLHWHATGGYPLTARHASAVTRDKSINLFVIIGIVILILAIVAATGDLFGIQT